MDDMENTKFDASGYAVCLTFIHQIYDLNPHLHKDLNNKARQYAFALGSTHENRLIMEDAFKAGYLSTLLDNVAEGI